MASSKFDNLWKLMTKNNFELDGKVNSNCLCTICNKLLIEPYTSECGCHFCKSCIRNFLTNGSKLCPGKSPDCFQTLLEFEKNVLTDFTTIFKMAKMCVKCPYENCTLKVELEKMEEHIRFCTLKPTNCPFQSIGCEYDVTLISSINEHLHSDTIFHSQILIEAFNNLKNDFDITGKIKTEDFRNSKDDIKELKDSDERNRNKIVELQSYIDLKVSEIASLKTEIDKLKKSEKVPKKDFETLKNATDRNKNEMDRFKKEFSELRNVFDELQRRNLKAGDTASAVDPNDTKFTLLSSELNDIKSEIEIIKKGLAQSNSKDLEKQMKKNEKEIGLIKGDIIKYTDGIKKLKNQLNEVIVKVTNDFIWIIDELSKKKGQVHSDVFSKFYYKFNLSFKRTGDSLMFCIHIVKGEFDDIVEWPMRHVFSINIINRDAMTVHKSAKCSFATVNGDKNAFNKPDTDCNALLGGLSISLKDMKAAPGVILNDSLMIGCTVAASKT